MANLRAAHVDIYIYIYVYIHEYIYIKICMWYTYIYLYMVVHWAQDQKTKVLLWRHSRENTNESKTMKFQARQKLLLWDLFSLDFNKRHRKPKCLMIERQTFEESWRWWTILTRSKAAAATIWERKTCKHRLVIIHAPGKRQKGACGHWQQTQSNEIISSWIGHLIYGLINGLLY